MEGAHCSPHDFIFYVERYYFIMLSVERVLTRSQRKQFIQFQNNLYRDCENYVPTMLSDELANLDEKKIQPLSFVRPGFSW